MEKTQEDKRIETYFRRTVILKGIISFAETVAGIVAFFVPLSLMTDYLLQYANGRLIDKPEDFIATHVLTFAQHFSHDFSLTSTTFLGIFLLARGLIKLLLIIALLKKKLWAYPSSLIVIGIFVIYQIYEIIATFSILLILLTIFDLVVMWFIWKEYGMLKAYTANNESIHSAHSSH